MTHFAILAPEAAGNLAAFGALGHELRRRGHQLTLITGPQAAPMAQRLELPLFVLRDAQPSSLLALLPLLLAARMIGLHWAVALRRRWMQRARLLLDELPAALREMGAGALLVDRTVAAAGSVAEHLRLPFITVATGVMWNEETQAPPHFTGWPYAEGRWPEFRNRLGYAAWHAFTRAVLRTINRRRESWGLPRVGRIAETLSPLLQISQMCPELDFPRRRLPPHLHYVGVMATSRPGQDCPFPWDQLDGRPLIYASLGTVRAEDLWKVFRKIAAACAGLDAQLVIALGRWREGAEQYPSQAAGLPGSPITVDYAPQVALLEKATLLITHAGANTVLESLSRGVPMVALPRAADQPAMAARLVHAGVGLRASYRRFTPRELRGLAERVLGDPAFRQRAGHLRRCLENAGGVRREADLVERAAATGRPVFRPEVAGRAPS